MSKPPFKVGKQFFLTALRLFLVHPLPMPNVPENLEMIRFSRPEAGRMGPQGNHARRERDARPDQPAAEVRTGQGAEGRTHSRMPAHDHPDCRPDRDAARIGGRGKNSSYQLLYTVIFDYM